MAASATTGDSGNGHLGPSPPGSLEDTACCSSGQERYFLANLEVLPLPRAWAAFCHRPTPGPLTGPHLWRKLPTSGWQAGDIGHPPWDPSTSHVWAGLCPQGLAGAASGACGVSDPLTREPARPHSGPRDRLNGTFRTIWKRPARARHSRGPSWRGQAEGTLSGYSVLLVFHK